MTQEQPTPDNGFASLIDDEALANRHRPRRLSDVVGQEDVVRVLMAQNRSGKRQHRVKLFSGPSGCGKTTIARALAAFELCDNPDLELGDACGSCDSCLSVIDGRRTHPDVHEHDASSNTSRKEDVERLVRRFDIVPMRGKVQVFILDEAQGLSRAAEDALLTHIENLAPHNRVYLLTTEPEAVPATIRGRSQHFRLELPSPSDVSNFLVEIARREGWNLSDDVARVITDLTPDSEGVRQAVTNLSKLAVLFEDGSEVTPSDAAALLGVASEEVSDEIIDAVLAGDASAALSRLITARETSSANDLYRSLARRLRHRWRESVLAGHPASQLTVLSDLILDALRADEYVDFLIELGLVTATAPQVSVAAPAQGSPQSPVTDVRPGAKDTPAGAPPAAESSTESPAGPQPTEGSVDSVELVARLTAALESQTPSSPVVKAVISHAHARADGAVLELGFPNKGLAGRLGDARHAEVLRRAASSLGFTEVRLTE